MAGLSARQYDAHYRRLGLLPGATPAAIETAAEALRTKLSPERLSNGPLKEIAPLRLNEIDESKVLLIGYWQRYGSAPPSVQNRAKTAGDGLSRNDSASSAVLLEAKTPPSLALEEASDKPAEIAVLKVVGPEMPAPSLSFTIFKALDGAVAPSADVFRPLSIIALVVLASVWVAVPVIVVRSLALLFADLGIDTWLDYMTVLAKVIPICFVPPFVLYEYAFFRQMQFPFAGAIRLPVQEALERCAESLTVESIGNSAGWSIESRELEKVADETVAGEIIALYEGGKTAKSLPLKIHLRLEKLGDSSSFLVYWFELDWRLQFKGKAVSCMKSARFEMDRLIKES